MSGLSELSYRGKRQLEKEDFKERNPFVQGMSKTERMTCFDGILNSLSLSTVYRI